MQNGEPPSLSGMKVMGIRNCVSVRFNVTDLVWYGFATDIGLKKYSCLFFARFFSERGKNGRIMYSIFNLYHEIQF